MKTNISDIIDKLKDTNGFIKLYYLIIYYPIYWKYIRNGNPRIYGYSLKKYVIFPKIIYSIIFMIISSLFLIQIGSYWLLLTNIPSLLALVLLYKHYKLGKLVN